MRAFFVVLIGTLVLTLAACAPEQDEPFHLPTATSAPTASPGAADVADAVAVYEEYVAATNAIVFADESTWAASLDTLQDPYLSQSKTDYANIAAEGSELEGDAVIVSVEASDVYPSVIRLHACLDVSGIVTVERNGNRVPNVAKVSSINVLLENKTGSTNGWRIGHIGRSDLPCE